MRCTSHTTVRTVRVYSGSLSCGHTFAASTFVWFVSRSNQPDSINLETLVSNHKTIDNNNYMNKTEKDEFLLMGLKLNNKTTNENGQSGIDCGNLWQKFET